MPKTTDLNAEVRPVLHGSRQALPELVCSVGGCGSPCSESCKLEKLQTQPS